MLVLATYDRMIGPELDQLPTTLDRLADLQAVPRPLPDSPWLSLDAGHDYSMVHLDLPRRGIIGQFA